MGPVLVVVYISYDLSSLCQLSNLYYFLLKQPLEVSGKSHSFERSDSVASQLSSSAGSQPLKNAKSWAGGCSFLFTAVTTSWSAPCLSSFSFLSYRFRQEDNGSPQLQEDSVSCVGSTKLRPGSWQEVHCSSNLRQFYSV